MQEVDAVEIVEQEKATLANKTTIAFENPKVDKETGEIASASSPSFDQDPAY